MLTETLMPEKAGALPRMAGYAALMPGGALARRKVIVSVDQDDEARWVECLKKISEARDQAAFTALFRHFAPRVKSFLARSGTGEALAEECMQDVMATVWIKAYMFDPSRASVATWVFTIARNRKIDMLRRQRRPEPEDLPWGPEAEPGPAEALAFRQEAARLGTALQTLPPPQRELIERAFFGDLSHGEIARETGLPLGTIKSRIRLALDRLRHAMKSPPDQT
ncbi:MAG: sigma-70 family RNA polymerase sigma factor [Rhodobacteraceae bacterium]|nr:sigma-70 family RNA polymerase sigma factor [Paracoccaceae bacterium]